MNIEVYDLKKHPMQEFIEKIKGMFKKKKDQKKIQDEDEIVDLSKHDIQYINK